jgi:hypothetical protein
VISEGDVRGTVGFEVNGELLNKIINKMF